MDQAAIDRPIVVFGFDDRIARHSPRALNSLSRNTRHDLDVIILARRWRPWTQAYYRALELDRLRIWIFDMSAVSVAGDLRLLAHTTAATMDRLYLPMLLPDADRVVYLDTDLICLDDLAPLYELALPESGIAAKPSVKEGYATLPDLVRTWAHPEARETILGELIGSGAPMSLRTFNAGVLVMDLGKLRRRSFVRTTLDLVQRFGVNDQLAINLYTKGEFEPLDSAWNVFVGQDASDAPHIIHWAGPKKPWNTNDLPFKSDWDAYAREYDPMRQWIGALLGTRPVNPVQRVEPHSLML
ncbi:MAG TPA: glycosyltransferase [Gemmatimonadales bacterium]|nr:glycosyltransferase [Gemmatimonadales bacterium]